MAVRALNQAEQLRHAKETLRRRVLRRRRGLQEGLSIFWSQRVLARLTFIRAFVEARSVAMYADVRGEVRTMGMVEEAISRGRGVALPRIDPSADEIELYWIEDPRRDLHPGFFGIPEPEPLPSRRVMPGDVDVFLVPGVVFDLHGYRLGYGRGYYDRLLSKYGGRTIGLAYEFQVVPAVPKSRRDVRMDAVVTEKRIIKVGELNSA